MKKSNTIIALLTIEAVVVAIAAIMFITNLLFPGALTIRTVSQPATATIEQPAQQVADITAVEVTEQTESEPAVKITQYTLPF